VEVEKNLEEVNPDPGALRLEARAIYLGRLVDAVTVALTKHDPLGIPVSTRLGRIGASLPTCMACDRPLNTRGKKTRAFIEEDKIERKSKLTLVEEVEIVPGDGENLLYVDLLYQAYGLHYILSLILDSIS